MKFYKIFTLSDPFFYIFVFAVVMCLAFCFFSFHQFPEVVICTFVFRITLLLSSSDSFFFSLNFCLQVLFCLVVYVCLISFFLFFSFFFFAMIYILTFVFPVLVFQWSFA